MTIANAHKLLDQELLTVPEALLGQHQDVRQALVSLVGTVDVVILDGSTLFSEWFSAARSGTSPRKQAQRFVGSVRAEADHIVAATAGRIHLVIVFDHASARPALKARPTHTSRDNGNGVRRSPQVSPDNFQRRSSGRHTDPMTEWLTNFGGQAEPTLAGHVFDMSSEVTVIISAHEADPLIAASTRVGVIGSHRVVRVIDLKILEGQGKFPGAEGRFVAGLMMGCDYLPIGLQGYGPAKLEKLDPSVFQLATWSQGYEHATAVLYRVGTKLDAVFSPSAMQLLPSATCTTSSGATWSQSHRAPREPSNTPPGSSSPTLRSMGVRTNTCVASPRPRCGRSVQPRTFDGPRAQRLASEQPPESVL
ncbi:BQ5605_C004g02996 [Microbotryum silenes-dioicae]|uniref:BQ5605_C004g02996 protein n=1 Tax=Microbotryum silenes-dioicae TaxID=796604 RepID=A0A2X0PBF3_9BASI|nr:BQ5605_C004g02996 [Microbotryum silenes-dioicae]